MGLDGALNKAGEVAQKTEFVTAEQLASDIPEDKMHVLVHAHVNAYMHVCVCRWL